MADVDQNSPTVEINVDTSEAQENIKALDTVTAKSVESMNKNVNSFKENVNKTFNDLKNGGGLFSNPNGQGASKSETVSNQRKQEAIQKRMVTYEEEARKQRNQQVENGKQLLKSFRDMTVAIAGISGAGLGAKALLDFSHNIGRLQQFLKATSSNPANALAYRNEFKRRQVDENSYWGAYQNVNSTLNQYQWGNGGRLPQNVAHAYNVLKQFSPDLQTGFKEGGSINTDVQFKNIVNALNRMVKENPQKYTHGQMIDIAKSALGGDEILAQAALSGRLNIDKASMEKARKEATSMDANRKIDEARQDLATTFESEMAKVLANISPMAIDFMKALNSFLSQNGELAITIALLGGFSGSILGLLKVLRVAKGVIGFGGTATGATGGAVRSGLVAGAKGVKSAVGFAGRNAGRALKYGTSLPVAVGIGMVDPTETAVTTPEAIARDRRKKKIEQALDGKVKQSFWNDKFYVQTKSGAYIYIDSDFYEPIDRMKRRLANGQVNKDGSSDGIMGSIIPQAKAGDLSYTPQLDASKGGSTKWNAGNSADVKSKQQYLEKLEEQYDLPKGSLDAQWLQESSRGRNMLSKAGAKGDFGFMDETAREYGVNVKDFGSSARGAAKYMQTLLKRYHGDINKARAAYNWGMGNVDKAVRTDGQNWLNRAPGETRNYVNQVAMNAQAYRARSQQPINRPTPYQTQLQAQTQKVHNEYKNSTANTTNNAANTNQHNTVNIHVANGTVENVRKGVQEGLKFPQSRAFDGLSGVT